MTDQPNTTETPVSAPKPTREPRVWLLRSGGLQLQGEDGQRVSVRLMPRELRHLGRRLVKLAQDIDGEQPTRIGEGWVDGV